MLRRLIALVLLLGLVVVLAAPIGQAAAIDIFPSCGSGSAGGTPAVCNDVRTGQASPVDPIVVVIADIVTVVSFIIGVAAIVGIVISGLRLAMANGDPNSIAAARSGLIYSLIGVIVAALAGVIVNIVVGRIAL